MMNRMKHSLSLLVLMLVAVHAGAQSADADIQQECRQEAQEYGVDAELMDQYIRDCVSSRGGVVTTDEPAVDAGPPSADVDEVPDSDAAAPVF